MRVPSSVFFVLWILSGQEWITASHPFDATLSRRSTTPDSPEKGPRIWNLPRVPWSRKALSEPEPPVELSPAPRLNPRMLVEALLEGVLSSEITSRLASILGVDPTEVLLVANLGVHAVWQLARGNLNLTRFMNRHFVLRTDDFSKQRVHTVLLSGYSHQDEQHLLSNMGPLLLLGPQFTKLLGNRAYSYFYIAAIYASDLFDQLVYKNKFQHVKEKARFLFWEIKLPSRGSMGASGAISALISYYCLKHPAEQLSMMEMEDLAAEALNKTTTKTMDASCQKESFTPAWVFGLTLLLSDLFPARGTNVAHGAHLGGHLFGLTFFLLTELWNRFRNPKRKNWRRLFRRRRRSFRSRLRGVKSACAKFGRFLGRTVAELIEFVESELEKEMDENKKADLPRPPTGTFHERLEKLKSELEKEMDQNKANLIQSEMEDREASSLPRPPAGTFHDRLKRLDDHLESEHNCEGTRGSPQIAGAI